MVIYKLFVCYVIFVVVVVQIEGVKFMFKIGLEDLCFAGVEYRSNYVSRRYLYLVWQLVCGFLDWLEMWESSREKIWKS